MWPGDKGLGWVGCKSTPGPGGVLPWGKGFRRVQGHLRHSPYRSRPPALGTQLHSEHRPGRVPKGSLRVDDFTLTEDAETDRQTDSERSKRGGRRKRPACLPWSFLLLTFSLASKRAYARVLRPAVASPGNFLSVSHKNSSTHPYPGAWVPEAVLSC